MDLRVKALRSRCLLVLMFAACDPDTEVAPGTAPGGPCTARASVTREELEAGGVICEHQTLSLIHI